MVGSVADLACVYPEKCTQFYASSSQLMFTYDYDYKLPGFGGAEMGRYPADDPARDPGRDVGTGGYSIALVRPNLNILTIRKYSLGSSCNAY